MITIQTPIVFEDGTTTDRVTVQMATMERPVDGEWSMSISLIPLKDGQPCPEKAIRFVGNGTKMSPQLKTVQLAVLAAIQNFVDEEGT